jgi:hypothetical protein
MGKATQRRVKKLERSGMLTNYNEKLGQLMREQNATEGSRRRRWTDVGDEMPEEEGTYKELKFD